MKVKMFSTPIQQDGTTQESFRQDLETYLSGNETRLIKTVELIVPKLGTGLLASLIVIVYIGNFEKD